MARRGVFRSDDREKVWTPVGRGLLPVVGIAPYVSVWCRLALMLIVPEGGAATAVDLNKFELLHRIFSSSKRLNGVAGRRISASEGGHADTA
ncbi:hypothetical protein HRbin08_00673 [bacterium HR08]|nr:hypothetical protein HRbin08_00673 [bacterium HR08]